MAGNTVVWPFLDRPLPRPRLRGRWTLGPQLLLFAVGCVPAHALQSSHNQQAEESGTGDVPPAEQARAKQATRKPTPLDAHPVLCSSEEQSACAVLLRADQLLLADQPAAASAELASLRKARDLISEAAELRFEDASPAKYWSGLVIARTLLLSASLSFGQGDERSRGALDLLERMKGGAPPGELIHRLELDLTRAHLALGDAERAWPLAQRVVERHPDDAEGQASLGIALLGLGRVEQSVGPLRRAQQLQPDEPERWLVLGTAQMLLSDAPAAERSFRAALAATSRAGKSAASTEEVLARCYGDLGAVLLVQGQAEQGRSYLLRALQLRPQKATFVANLAYAEYLLGNFQKAEAEARKAIAADGRLVAAWLNLGLAQAQQKKFVEARQSFTHAQSLDPSDPRPHQSLADLEEVTSREAATKAAP